MRGSYIGVGVSADGSGAEGAISQNVVLYGDGTYFTNGGGTMSENWCWV